MTSSTSRFATTILGAVVLSATLGGKAAFAQGAESATCPCLTSELVDSWFQRLDFIPDQPKQMHACVDDPGFTTFDYLDRSEHRRAMYIDLTYPTSKKQARCLVRLTTSPTDIRARGDAKDFRAAITPAEARACRMEVLQSQAWRRLSCPSSKRNRG